MTNLTIPQSVTEATPTDLAVLQNNDSYQELREVIQTLYNEYWKISASCIYIAEAYRSTFILWLFLTHLKDYIQFAPILLIDAETRGCGKSTLQQFLAVMRGMCPEDRWSDFTKAGLKKLSGDGVIFLDEIDSISKTDFKNAANFLNTSFEANGAQSVNVYGSAASFGFRCVSGIKVTEKMQPATLSRCIHLKLVRTPPTKKLTKQFKDLPLKHLYDLADETKEFFEKHAAKFQYYFSYVQYPQQAVLSNRFGDVWRNMFDLATLIGEECVNNLMTCVSNQQHLDETVHFPEMQYFVNVQQYNEPEEPQFYDGTDDISTDYSTNDFLTALKAVLIFHEKKASTGVKTKECFAYITQLKIKDAPPTQRTLGRYMTDLGFKINKNIRASSGYRYDETLQTLADKYSKSVNEVRYQQYLEQLQAA